MPNRPDPEATVDQRALELARTIPSNPNSTIVPAAVSLDDAGKQAVQMLADIDIRQRLVLQEPIGEGGMGLVRAGVQLSLGRPVAIKTLKHDQPADRGVVKLLREAWVTGSLEHPNVVPVYDVSIEEGRPYIVLKRIAGKVWSTLMRDAESVRDAHAADDLLEWNLRIFVQVCNAVEFAHARGIIHRDLKPENVMVGDYGEVYLLDWGIALSLKDDGSGRFPVLEREHGVAGTPHYMAPEMLATDPSALSERTDVYLLGSVLYEIVCGHPPHSGSTMLNVLARVAASTPSFPAHAPAELVAIIRHAIARDPNDRFDSAQALRLAVQGFIEHRGSTALVTASTERLEQLRRDLAQARSDDEVGRMGLYTLFSECRFGLQQALSAWPDNVPVRRALAEATTSMVDFELERGDARAASSLLAQLDKPDAGLAARVERQLERSIEGEREKEALAELGRGVDPRVGERTRLVLTMLFGVVFVAIALLGAVGNPFFQSQRQAQLVFSFVVLGMIALAAPFAWKTMTETAFNRTVGAALIIAIVAGTLLTVADWMLGVDTMHTHVIQILIWAVAAAIATVAVEWRLVPVPVTLLAGFLVAVRWPALRFWSMAAGLSVATITATALWSRRQRR